jgi:hypothetical protein
MLYGAEAIGKAGTRYPEPEGGGVHVMRNRNSTRSESPPPLGFGKVEGQSWVLDTSSR